MSKLYITIVKLISFSFINIFLLVSTSEAGLVTRGVVVNNDTFVGYCSLATPSSLTAEVGCFAASGVTVTEGQLFQSPFNFYPLYLEPDVGWQGLPLAYAGSHFLLNLGIDTGTYPNTFVFQNLTDNIYAVIGPEFFLSLVGLFGEEYVLSLFSADLSNFHVTSISTLATPLPAALWMMISALGGIFVVKRMALRRRRS